MTIKNIHILLGFESILTEMAHQTQGEKDRLSLIGNITCEKKRRWRVRFTNTTGVGFLRNRRIRSPFANRKGNNKKDEGTKHNATEDLKYILKNGPRLGYHFIMAFGTVGDLNQSKIDIAWFKHKIMFRTAKNDAVTIVGQANASIISGLEDHSYRYSNGLEALSFRPYLHPGLSWDGWHLCGDCVINTFDETEEYLL